MILLATYGASYLLQSKDKHLKVLLSILLITSTIQFGFFLNDYHGEYRTRSYGWFNNNIGGALTTGLQATKSHRAQALYIDQRILFANRYSKFYQIKTNINVKQLQHLFNPDAIKISQLPASSIVVVKSDHTPFQQDRNLVKLIGSAHEPDGNPSFYIYLRE